LLEKADSILIGGGMAFTFLKARGLETGTSLVEEESLNFAVEMLGKARSSGVSIVLPEDVKIGTSPEDKEGRTVKASSIPSDRMGLDIGPDTVELFKKVIKGSHTVLWNGPLGVFENPVFAEGTKEIAAYIAERTDNKELFSVIGGGDSAAAVKKFKYETRMSHVSTGGGASLEFFEKEILPGVEPLSVDE
jgi:phosphoglycerate kinase